MVLWLSYSRDYRRRIWVSLYHGDGVGKCSEVRNALYHQNNPIVFLEEQVYGHHRSHWGLLFSCSSVEILGLACKYRLAVEQRFGG